jgi:PIN domain
LATNYVLIDFENVQPKNPELLTKHPFKVFVFHGSKQTKVSTELASAIQPLGKDARYVKITGNGRNALDFHIAFYLGELAASDEEGHFYIVSKDTGFDPLIAHLKGKKIHVQRVKELGEIPLLHKSGKTSDDKKIAAILKKLKGMGPSKPRSLKALKSTINTVYQGKLDESELTSLIDELKKLKHIYVADTKVTYTPPA